MPFATRVYDHLHRIKDIAPECVSDAARRVIDNVRIIESNKMTRAAGSASVDRMMGMIIPRSIMLKLSIPLMGRCTHEQQDMIILHELAHLLDFFIRGNSNHDDVWKTLCINIGGDGNQFHSISRVGLERTVTRYVWLDMVAGSEVMVKIRTHQILTIRRGMNGRYKFIKEVKYKGREVVSEIPAEYAV